MVSMITSTAWVRRGVAAQFPEKYELDEDEINRISELARVQLEDAKTDLKTAREETQDDEMEIGGDDNSIDETLSQSKSKKKGKESSKMDSSTAQTGTNSDVLKEYDMDHYDSDAVDEDGEEVTMFGNVKSLAYHQPHEEDPYLVVPEGEDEDNEREELQIMPSDNLILSGKVEDEVAHLEVYVYEDAEDNLYVHHDIMLPAIPLCLEWLDIPVGRGSENRSHGNFVAVGTMEPDIEIWDLDVVDCMYPNAILGQGGEEESTDKKSKKKKKKSKKANDSYHIDSVLALAANRQHRNLLASGSADQTVKLWDLNTLKCAKSYANHKDKICSLDWHPKESTILLSGSYDKTIVAADMRAPEAKAATFQVASDVENVRWDPHDPNFFYVTTDNGIVCCHDIRKASANSESIKPLWTLQAHDSSVSAFDVHPYIPGFIATGSTDKSVKLWNIQDHKPSMVVSRKLEVGKVFSTTFAPDQEVSFRLAVAGSKGVVQVWDTSTNAAVRRAFASRLGAAIVMSEAKEERLVGVARDDGGDSDDEEEMNGGEGPADAGQDGWESMDED
ncbi:rRNA-processing protein [Ophidiomyces ophidiicola]|nr:rRNA-processing protein [Ophidiomyces ophidiicola]KAI2051505.1 rRNA-processing protein [Ophidiomyces ophidiicola]KAI2076446.1 rRNA-processing protein [Ophidiomyces ophidiicola]KAI2077222.1 rRNA-processing protein [Ophidiomyces ophidiicola]KAI2097535.1 rRNA-processing protein [Ophidiomyces ophidiicola]